MSQWQNHPDGTLQSKELRKCGCGKSGESQRSTTKANHPNPSMTALSRMNPGMQEPRLNKCQQNEVRWKLLWPWRAMLSSSLNKSLGLIAKLPRESQPPTFRNSTLIWKGRRIQTENQPTNWKVMQQTNNIHRKDKGEAYLVSLCNCRLPPLPPSSHSCPVRCTNSSYN